MNANKKFYNLCLKIIVEKYKTKYFKNCENDRLKVLIKANAFLQRILKNKKKKIYIQRDLSLRIRHQIRNKCSIRN